MRHELTIISLIYCGFGGLTVWADLVLTCLDLISVTDTNTLAYFAMICIVM